MPSLSAWLLAALATVQVAQGANPSISRTARCGASFGLTCEGSTFGNCCSRNGWCGSNKNYCGDGCQAGWGKCDSASSPEPAPVEKVSVDGRCSESSGTCKGSKFGDCCSQYGWCGSSKTYCEKGCNPLFGKCSGSQPSQPSSAAPVSSPSRISIPSVPSASPSPAMPISNNARCGSAYNASPKGMTCKGSKFGNCCSKYSYCGTTDDYCGTGCQPGFGDCKANPSSSPVASSSVISSPVASPSVVSSSAVISSTPVVAPSSTPVVIPSSTPDAASSTPVVIPSSTPDAASSTPVVIPSSTPDAASSTPVVVPSSTPDAASSTPVVIPSSTPDAASSTPVVIPSSTPDAASSTPVVIPSSTPAVSTPVPTPTPSFVPSGVCADHRYPTAYYSDLIKFETGSSLAACQQACAIDSRCQLFFVHQNVYCYRLSKPLSAYTAFTSNPAVSLYELTCFPPVVIVSSSTPVVIATPTPTVD